MPLESLTTLLSACAEGVVLGLALYRGLRRTFPAFIGFIAWSLLSDGVAFSMIHASVSAEHYLLFYQNVLVIDLLVRAALLIEIALSVFAPIVSGQKRTAMLILAGIAAFLSVLIWPLIPPLFDVSLYGSYVMHLVWIAPLLTMIWLIGLGFVSHLLGLRWKEHTLQIAGGLFVYVLLNVCVTLLMMHQATYHAVRWLSAFMTLGYLALLAFWALCFAMREPNDERW